MNRATTEVCGAYLVDQVVWFMELQTAHFKSGIGTCIQKLCVFLIGIQGTETEGGVALFTVGKCLFL